MMLQHLPEARRRAIMDATEVITDYLFGRTRSLPELMDRIQEQVEYRLQQLEHQAAEEQALEYQADQRGSRY